MMNVDTDLFGRTTYQMFKSYWPQVATNPQAPEAMRIMADELNEMTKVVFSKTLNDVTWQNTLLFNKNLEDEVKKLKQGEGCDITIFGSGSLVKSLANQDLIDEYLLAVTTCHSWDGKILL
jgi:dihydrofolate reductase